MARVDEGEPGKGSILDRKGRDDKPDGLNSSRDPRFIPTVGT